MYKLLELFDESNIGLAEQMNYWLNDVCQNNDYGQTNNWTTLHIYESSIAIHTLVFHATS